MQKKVYCLLCEFLFLLLLQLLSTTLIDTHMLHCTHSFAEQNILWFSTILCNSSAAAVRQSCYELMRFLVFCETSPHHSDGLIKKKTNDDKINSPVNYDVKHARNDGPMLFITRFSRASKEPFYRKQFNAISSNSATYLISTR